MPLAPGSALGPYVIVGPLGAGGMGVVYRARDRRLGREVAIKSMPPGFTHDAERLSRFEREARLLASLNHPNIGAIYGLEDAGGLPHLVLELVEGETLSARIARGPLDIETALAVFSQIAAALEAAHERGIVHRDLKPGNVMLTPAGHVKVLDFGLARSDAPAATGDDQSRSPTVTVHASATEAGVILGTAAYMSPEQVRGRPVDRRSDVWSFGCVMYECLSARPTFAGETTSDLIARILEREPDWNALPDATPAPLRELVRRCLRKDADARPRDVRDVRIELQQLAAGGERKGVARENSIAVLPFDNQSGPDDEYFADGMTDEILNALAQVEGLRVAARTSCFAFKGRREDLRGIGERLDVATVLEGTVRRAGARLRITAQLVKVSDGYQMWSERYDREMTDVFAVQDEIANAIASRLRGALHGEADRTRVHRGTKNLEAYELLLKGRALQARRGRFLRQAIVCFERAIELDPEYAEAMAWLADSYRLMGTFGVSPAPEVMPKARQIAERALQIEPNLAEALATLASVAEQYERDFPAAEAAWSRALEIDPRHSRSRSHRALWWVNNRIVPAEAALAEAARAVADEPLSSWVSAMNSYVLGFAGEHEQSIVEAERAISLDADSFFAQWSLMRAHAWAGHHGQAMALAPELLATSGRHQWALGTLGWSYGKAMRVADAQAVFAEIEGRSRHEFVSPFWLAATAHAAGEADTAIEFVRRAVAERDPLVVDWGRWSPFWDGPREHRHFEEAVRGVWS